MRSIVAVVTSLLLATAYERRVTVHPEGTAAFSNYELPLRALASPGPHDQLLRPPLYAQA
jgi:hypothetical protein